MLVKLRKYGLHLCNECSEVSPMLSLEAQIPISKLKSQPRSSNPSILAQITASRLKSQPQGSNHSLKAQIPILMLKFKPRVSKISKHTSSALRGRCPSYHHTTIYTHIGAMGTADHLTFLRLQFVIICQLISTS